MCQESPQEGISNDVYLSTLSPKDKPWDVHKKQSKQVKGLYEGTVFDRYAERIDNCGGFLGFKWASDPDSGEVALKLNAVRFCRCRHCPICQWRKSLMWIARFLKAMPLIIAAYPKARYLFLTLTVKNCKVEHLRATLDEMNKAWNRMRGRKGFPAIGFARSTEVTKAADFMAHPHFHALLMVDPGYFAGKNYMTQADWTELWQSCLKVDYTPIVHIRAVKSRIRASKGDVGIISLDEGLDASKTILGSVEEISSAIVETFKYAIKPESLVGTGSKDDQEWLVAMTSQLFKTRSVALGGVFKKYISEKEPENLISEDSEEETDKMSDIYFGWKERFNRYIKEEFVNILGKKE